MHILGKIIERVVNQNVPRCGYSITCAALYAVVVLSLTKRDFPIPSYGLKETILKSLMGVRTHTIHILGSTHQIYCGSNLQEPQVGYGSNIFLYVQLLNLINITFAREIARVVPATYLF